jgi:hypothetical protein
MDMETLTLLLEAGPNAANMGIAFFVSEAVSNVAKFAIGFGTFFWCAKKWVFQLYFDMLTLEQKQEYLQRKFKVGKPNEEEKPSDV